MINSPCFKCSHRQKFCAMSCNEYKEYKATIEIIRKEQSKNNDFRDYICGKLKVSKIGR